MSTTPPTLPMPETPERVVSFWRDAGYAHWFTSDTAFDALFHTHFLGAHMAAARRELDGWLDSANGCLALLILLDQFPRNAFRGTAHMYATDPLSLFIARHMLDRGFDKELEHDLRAFCYLPFEHSENMADQDESLRLFETLGGAFLPYARTHRDVIVRFGRFPHRNRELGRQTTPEEQKFLDDGGFAG